MPTNLYGPNDNFDLSNSHVLPALLRKIHAAKISNSPNVSVWGSGQVKREFLHVDDMAEACVFMMKQSDYKQIINVGSGEEISIRELAELICEIVEYEGVIV